MDAATGAWPPAAFFVEGGTSDRGSAVVGAGVAWPLRWQGEGLGGRLSLAMEAALHAWSARQAEGGRQRSMQVSATPVVRWRGDGGASPWFLEAGVGLSYHGRDYVSKDDHQSTRWNFNDVIGFGRVVGKHEVGLRLAHFSNSGLRKPNPGDTSVSLRWAFRF